MGFIERRNGRYRARYRDPLGRQLSETGVLARDFGAAFIFKGGTSLSKGYRIVERFSEDIDVPVLPAGTRVRRDRQADEGHG
jgi:hypothetical protein